MNSIELNKKIADISNGNVILMFSAGKESICCYYQLKKYFKKIELVYQYIHPNLEFVNDTLSYFENKFNQKIHRIPHIGLFRMLREYVYCPPSLANINEALGIPAHKYTYYYDCLREDFNMENAFVALGVRENDGPVRRMSIKKNGPLSVSKKSFFPVYDWLHEDIRNCFKENNVKLPVDYEMFGRSFDGLTYNYIKPIKERFPNDFEKLKELFPLLELEILRYEQI